VTYGTTSVHVKSKLTVGKSGSSTVTLKSDNTIVDISNTAYGTVAIEVGSDISAENPVVLALWLSGSDSAVQLIKDELAADGITAILAGDGSEMWNKLATTYTADMFRMLVVVDTLPTDATGKIYFNWNFGNAEVTQVSAAAVPEPATLGALTLGAGLILTARRRR